MARAGSEVNKLIFNWNRKLGSSGKWIAEFIEDVGGTLIILPIKKRLLQRGESGDGTILPPYSPHYIKFRKIRGFNTRPTTLRLTGDWYRSLKVFVGGRDGRHVIEVRPKGGAKGEAISNDTLFGTQTKTEYLKRRYGAAILTINQDEQFVLANAVAAEIKRVFEEDSNILFEL